MVGEVLRNTIEQAGQNVAQLDDFTNLNKNPKPQKVNGVEYSVHVAGAFKSRWSIKNQESMCFFLLLAFHQHDCAAYTT